MRKTGLDECRLVTVTGPGGVGKTRLAAEVAERVAGRFADGVWLVELATVLDPAQVPAATAAVLGVREQPGVAVTDSLAEMLGRQQMLLVLDSCEHMAGAAAEMCAALLQVADDVRILATSREPLGVAGEARYRLPPLTLPAPDDPAGIPGSEAGALFPTGPAAPTGSSRSAPTPPRRGHSWSPSWTGCRWRSSWPPRG